MIKGNQVSPGGEPSGTGSGTNAFTSTYSYLIESVAVCCAPDYQGGSSVKSPMISIIIFLAPPSSSIGPMKPHPSLVLPIMSCADVLLGE